MRALAGRIPRAFRNHKTPEGAAYGDYCRGMQARLRLGPEARPTLREAGLITVELSRLSMEIEDVRQKPNRKRDWRRLRREQRVLRSQLLTLERRLEELAQIEPSSPESVHHIR